MGVKILNDRVYILNDGFKILNNRVKILYDGVEILEDRIKILDGRVVKVLTDGVLEGSV